MYQFQGGSSNHYRLPKHIEQQIILTSIADVKLIYHSGAGSLSVRVLYIIKTDNHSQTNYMNNASRNEGLAQFNEMIQLSVSKESIN